MAWTCPIKRISNEREFRHIVYKNRDWWLFPEKWPLNRISDISESDISRFACITIGTPVITNRTRHWISRMLEIFKCLVWLVMTGIPIVTKALNGRTRYNQTSPKRYHYNHFVLKRPTHVGKLERAVDYLVTPGIDTSPVTESNAGRAAHGRFRSQKIISAR